MITWTSIFPFYEVRRVFLLHVLSSLPIRPILVWRWCHLILVGSDGNLVSRPCWISRLSFDKFSTLRPPYPEPNFGVSTCPQFWDKIILFQNYFSWPLHTPHSNHSFQFLYLGQKLSQIPILPSPFSSISANAIWDRQWLLLFYL